MQELDIRHSYEVTVVAINRSGERGEREVIIPAPDEVLRKGDMLVVLGEGDVLKHFKEVFSKGGTEQSKKQ